MDNNILNSSKVESVETIYSTTDFDQFHFFAFNRPGTSDNDAIKNDNLNFNEKEQRLVYSRTKPWISFFKEDVDTKINKNEPLHVCIYDNKLYVLDGQHRLNAFKELKKLGYNPVCYYKIINDLDTKEKIINYIINNNTVGKTWTIDDKVKSFVYTSDNEETREIGDFHKFIMNKYGFKGSLTWDLMFGQSSCKQENSIKLITKTKQDIWPDIINYCEYIISLKSELKRIGKCDLADRLNGGYFNYALRDNIWRKCNDDNIRKRILKRIKDNIGKLSTETYKSTNVWFKELKRLACYQTKDIKVKNFFN